LVGFFAAIILVLILALPPLISLPEDVHRLSAGILRGDHTHYQRACVGPHRMAGYRLRPARTLRACHRLPCTECGAARQTPSIATA
jgi:hypothetical protein